MVHCSITGCRSTTARREPNLTYHSYPGDITLKTFWIVATGRKNWQPKDYARVCSKHFEANCFIKSKSHCRTMLVKDTIPTLNLPFQNVLPKTEEQYSNNTSVKRTRHTRSKPVIQSVYSTSTPSNNTPQRTEHSASYFKTKDGDINDMDECELYGQLLARKLRRLDERQRDIAMHDIDNIMFRAKMNTDESEALRKNKSPVFVLTPQNEEHYDDEEYLEDPMHEES